MTYYTKIQILRINGLRSLSTTLAGTKDLGVAALGATNKMFWTEMHKEAMESRSTCSAAIDAHFYLLMQHQQQPGR